MTVELIARGRLPLPVDILAMADSEDQDGSRLLLHFANDAVIADTVPPKSFFLSVQRFAELARILEMLNALSEVPNDFGLPSTVQFNDLFLSGPRNLSAPSQGGAPTLPG